MPEPSDDPAQAASVSRASTADRSSHARTTQRASDHARGRYPAPLNAGRSRNMQANRRSDTKPEIALRSLLHRRGLRFRKDVQLKIDGVRVRPDILFSRTKVAIFVDGCFWHVCPHHGRYPETNDWYWTPKLRANMERDKRAGELLNSHGWLVIRAWEHENVIEVADRIEHAVRSARG